MLDVKMMLKYTDVQNKSPVHAFHLTRVGVTGVTRPVLIQRPKKTVTLIPTFSVFVSLPAEKKGSHMSRDIEVVDEIIDQLDKAPSLESLCARMAKSLLERHEYAEYAEVGAEAKYFLERASPSGRKTNEEYGIIAKASIRRGKLLRKTVGVEVIGMTACPCAMETAREMMRVKYPDLKVDGIPIITHNQRNRCKLMIELDEKHEVEADDLIEIAEKSLSSPTYEVLKRQDEGAVVMMAHQSPKFVEDVVRDMLRGVLEKYKEMPDDTIILAQSEAEESIHKHNAFAERGTALGELRK